MSDSDKVTGVHEPGRGRYVTAGVRLVVLADVRAVDGWRNTITINVTDRGRSSSASAPDTVAGGGGIHPPRHYRPVSLTTLIIYYIRAAPGGLLSN